MTNDKDRPRDISRSTLNSPATDGAAASETGASSADLDFEKLLSQAHSLLHGGGNTESG